jgi:hypothetical protein
MQLLGDPKQGHLLRSGAPGKSSCRRWQISRDQKKELAGPGPVEEHLGQEESVGEGPDQREWKPSHSEMLGEGLMKSEVGGVSATSRLWDTADVWVTDAALKDTDSDLYM